MLKAYALLAAALLSSPLLAQKTGAITGHVTYAGSNLPVRNARVTLEPVPQLNAPPIDSHGSLGTEGVHTIIETLPDGSFRFPDVKPGSYYVLADKLGSLSPISSLTRDDLKHPTEQGLARMAQLLALANVSANKTADVSIQLHPGATIAGIVRFDDGSPAIDIGVSLMTRDPKGKWTQVHTSGLGGFSGYVSTDDRGQYRIPGLSPGEYLVRTLLSITEAKVDFVFGDAGNTYSNSVYSLYLYQNDVLRPGDAEPIKLAEAQDSEGNNITIPLAKMHTLSGSLADRSGHPINAGKMELLFPASDDVLASAEVDPADNQFHFLYVPEGTYTLRVTEAKDVTREEIPYPKGTMPPTHTETKTLKTYGGTTQPLVLTGDQQNLIVTVPPAEPGATPPK